MSAHFLRAARLAAFLFLVLIGSTPVFAGVVSSEPPPGSDGGEPDPEPPSLRFRPPAAADGLADFVPGGAALLDWGTGEDVHVLDGREDVVVGGEAGAVLIEAGTFGEEGPFELQLAAGPVVVEQLSGPPAEQVVLARFGLEVRDGGGRPVATFARPARFALDLRAAGLDLDRDGGYFFLAYEDADRPGQYVDIPVTIHQPDGLISGETGHFSDWIAGWRPDSWSLDWTPPAVAPFSGAATFHYPLELPPGRAGLQPQLALSYDSAALRGAVRTVSAGTVAAGWSLTGVQIVRTRSEIEEHGFTYGDTFRLVLEGQGHRLIRGETAGGVTTFYVENAPDLRVYNHGGLRWNNNPQRHTYWIVKTGEGLTYRLGYTHQPATAGHDPSITYQQTRLNNNAGGPDQWEAMAWNVDTVTDASGNQITYSYLQPRRWESVGFVCPWNGGICDLQIWNHTSQLAEIRYNFAGQAAPHLPVPPTIGRLHEQSHASRVVFHYDDVETRLTAVDVYHGHANGASGPLALLRRYELDAQTISLANPRVCDRRRADGSHVVRYSATRVVNGIVEKTRDPAGRWHSLPPTTFVYWDLPQLHHQGEGCFLYKHLRRIDNGYGGQTDFIYAGDGRVRGPSFRNCKGWAPGDGSCREEFPAVGYNYRVGDVREGDRHDDLGAGSFFARTVYHYGGACYDQTRGDETTCAQPETTAEFGNIAGHAEVIATRYDFDGVTPLERSISTYHTTGALLGRPAVERSGPPDLNDWRRLRSGREERTETRYETTTFGGVGAQFTFVSEISRFTERWPSPQPESLSSRIRYRYDVGSGHQSDEAGRPLQLGEISHIEEYDSATASLPYRVTERFTRARTSGGYWLVRTHGEQIRDGETGQLRRVTWSYFDRTGETAAAASYTQGRLLRQRTATPTMISCSEVPGPVVAGCRTAYVTIDETFAYDSYGNMVEKSSFDDYGYLTVNGSGGLRDLPPAATGRRVTAVQFDAAYALYPLAVTNPLGQQTRFEVWGFGGRPLTGFQAQAGHLRRVIDPAGWSTWYEYDPFGRLYQSFEGGSPAGFGDGDRLNGDPLRRYEYYDNSWQGRWLPSVNGRPFGIVTLTRPAQFRPDTTGYALREVSYFDGFGRLIQSQSRHVDTGQGGNNRRVVMTRAYDALGREVCETVPFQVQDGEGYVSELCTGRPHRRTLVDHQDLGRQTGIAPDGTRSEQYFAIRRALFTGEQIDVSGRPFAVTNRVDGEGFTRTEAWDSLGRLRVVFERDLPGSDGLRPVYATTRYEYGLWDQITRLVDGSGGVTTMGYDDLGRMIVQEEPSAGRQTFAYDAAGNLVRQEDAAGGRVCFYYDSLDRLVRKTRVNAPQNCPATLAGAPASGDSWLASYEYDVAVTENGETFGGRPGAVSRISWSPDGVRHYELIQYDSQGRITARRRVLDGRVFDWRVLTFDGLDRPLRVAYPDGEEVTIRYDREGEDGLIVDSGRLPLIQGVGYNEHGRLTRIDRAPAPIADTVFHYAGQAGSFRLERIIHGGWANPADPPDFSYGYDRAGNVVEKTETGYGTERFTYDSQYRLASVRGAAEIDFRYDPVGNILETKQDGVVTQYQYDPARPQAVSELRRGSSTTARFTYDARGNMVRRVEGGRVIDQQFDAQNRLVTVGENGQAAQRYFYDAAGLRTMGVELGRTIYYPFPDFEEEERRRPGLALRAEGGGQADDGVLTIPPQTPYTIAWSSSEAAACTAAGSWSGGRSLQGSVTFAGFAAGERTYTLRCANDYHLAEQTVRVVIATLPPTATPPPTSTPWPTNTPWPTSTPLPTETPAPIPTGTPPPTATPAAASCAGLIREAEEGQLSGRFAVGSDPAASGGAFVRVPNGSGDAFQVAGNAHKVTLCFTVPATASYRLRGWVYADGSGSDSFFVVVDGRYVLPYHWDVQQNTSYGADYVSHRGGADPVELFLAAGERRVEIFLREDGTRLDRFMLERVWGGGVAFGGRPAGPLSTTDLSNSAAAAHKALAAAVTPPVPPSALVVDRLRRTSYRLAGRTVAVRTAGSPAGGNGVYWLFDDHLGSMVNLSDSAGQIVATQRFTPYGSGQAVGDRRGIDYGFTGQRQADRFGMIYLQGRYYLPELGRFVSPDPIVPDLKDPQAWNRYTYARNNPLLFVDPTGHCWGIAAGLRNTGIYRQTCINLDFALHIVTHPKATFGERVGAGSYIGLMAVAHVGAVAGTAVAGGACVVATSGICAGAATMPVASTAGTAGTAVCADGDCTNEARLAAQGVYRAGQYLAADGDPMNEIRNIDAINRAYGVSDDVISHLKQIGRYQQFNKLNERLSVSEIKNVIFDLGLRPEMIAGSNGNLWQYSYGLLRYIHMMGMEDDLIKVLLFDYTLLARELIKLRGGG